jgi:hypothetical protein
MTFSERTSSGIMDLSGTTVWSGGIVSGLIPQSGLDLNNGNTAPYAMVRDALRDSGTVGYKRQLDLFHKAYPAHPSFEMVVTQPKLVPMGNGRSLMAFTSFGPREASCGDFGDGYLYLVDTFTGLPDPSTLRLFTTSPEPDPQVQSRGLSVAGGLTTGKGAPSEAFIVSSASGITISASAPDASVTSIFIPNEGAGLSRITAWKEVLDFSLPLDPEAISADL